MRRCVPESLVKRGGIRQDGEGCHLCNRLIGKTLRDCARWCVLLSSHARSSGRCHHYLANRAGAREIDGAQYRAPVRVAFREPTLRRPDPRRIPRQHQDRFARHRPPEVATYGDTGRDAERNACEAATLDSGPCNTPNRLALNHRCAVVAPCALHIPAWTLEGGRGPTLANALDADGLFVLASAHESARLR